MFDHMYHCTKKKWINNEINIKFSIYIFHLIIICTSNWTFVNIVAILWVYVSLIPIDFVDINVIGSRKQLQLHSNCNIVNF